ncbi:GNAT family N-acetyltransferase [Amycolatopsis sp. NPDC051903]|uniref:GNAT family N-acetyltransferase n=1 Tax=Amycolatopsis sp. NPDC051903 TaxID=3363936 RepID=UPI0037AA7D66
MIRPPRCGDGEPVDRFLAGLSLASRYHRFFSGIRHITPDLVRAMTAVVPGQLVFLALDGDTVVGHVMAVYSAEAAVEIGVVVAEAYQYRGIGRRLVRELALVLVGHGLSRMRCDVLSENHFVLEWLRRTLPDIRIERNGETMTVHGTLAVLVK